MNADATFYNAWKLVSLSPFPSWLLALFGMAVLAGLALSLMAFRGEPHRARFWLAALFRVVAAGALMLLLIEPGQRLMQTTRVKNRLAIVLDRSASMAFPAKLGEKESRDEVARGILEASRSKLEAWAHDYSLEFYGFDRDLKVLDRSQLASLPLPDGAATDLAAALRQVMAEQGAAAGRKLSGVVLLSDGTDNGELAAGMTPAVTSFLRQSGIPVSTVSVAGEGLKDLAIDQVAVDDFAFVRSPLTLGVTIISSGFTGTEIPVTLKREGQVIATQKVVPTRDGPLQTSFTFTPDQTGQFLYSVEIPVFADEAVAENNLKVFTLKVIRDRVRVLLVVGHPSWDERFLRGLLRQDANVDLVSFFILRNMADDPKVRTDEELSLIPFPVQEIFHDQLKTFDLVILQNFAYDDRSYQVSQYLGEIRAYVEGGGALAMLGGENSFGEGHYDQTELAPALPVTSTGAPISTDSFRARLTEEGRRHPITQVAAPGEATEKAWGGLPEVDGIQFARPKPGARVLLEHPFAMVDGKNAPLVVVSEVGRGRSMAVLSDATWDWRFEVGTTGGNTRAYDRFWNNAIRWLVHDPDLTPVKVAAERATVEPKEPVAVRVSAKKADYGPAAQAEVAAELVRLEDNAVVARGTAHASSDGEARIELTAPRPGAYRVRAQAMLDGALLGKGEDVVAVRAQGAELSETLPRPKLLQEIAEASGGVYAASPTSLGKVPLIDPETIEVGRKKDVPLWDRWYAIVLVAAAVGGEWFLRRRWGYA